MTTESVAATESKADASGDGAAIGGGEDAPKTSIFGETMPTVEDLMGDAESGEKKAEASDKADNKEEKADDKKADDKKADDKSKAAASDDKAKEGAKAEDDKKKVPPEGYVEKEALTEARGEIKSLKDQINSLMETISSLKESKPEKKDDTPDPEAERWKTFKVLSREELKTLTEDDPTEAALYRDDLAEYKEYQKKVESKKTETETKTKAEIEKLHKAIDEATRATFQDIDTEVPGIYKRENGISKKLIEYAESIGIPAGSIALLTNPKTVIRQEGSDKEYILNKGALHVVRLLNKLSNSNGDRSALEKEIEKKYQTKFEADKKAWIAEIEKKMKGSDDFSSIGDIAASNTDGEIGGYNRVLSDKEFAKLGPKERAAYLNG